MHQYKELKLWQKSIDFTTVVYKVTTCLPVGERFNLISQINRSVISIPSNIAEGAGRNSDKEFLHFLSVAQASSFELETQLIIANRLSFLTDSQLKSLLDGLGELQRMNYKLQETLKNKSSR